MGDDVSRLFDEYAVRRARGERPDAEEYLARAGDHADELRGLLDRWVAAVPAPAPDPASVAAMEAVAAGEPPIVALRASRGLRRDEVVSALLVALGLRDDTRAKVKDYLHKLENGLLDPAGVNRRVWAALGEALGAPVEALAAWRVPVPPPAAAYYRADEPVVPAERAALDSAAPEPDEVDELFTGGPGDSVAT